MNFFHRHIHRNQIGILSMFTGDVCHNMINSMKGYTVLSHFEKIAPRSPKIGNLAMPIFRLLFLQDGFLKHSSFLSLYCLVDPSFPRPNPSNLECDTLAADYQPQHFCMNSPIAYDRWGRLVKGVKEKKLGTMVWLIFIWLHRGFKPNIFQLGPFFYPFFFGMS